MVNIAVIGGSRADKRYEPIAERIGELLAKNGATVICGGMLGVMEWVAKGAASAGGTVVGILPGTSTTGGNKFLTIRLPTGMGYARNFLVVRAADSVISIDGATGTLSEAAFALSEHKSVISIGDLHIDVTKEDDGKLFSCETPEEAVKKALSEAEKYRSENRGDSNGNWG